jgi:hypothetical protein
MFKFIEAVANIPRCPLGLPRGTVSSRAGFLGPLAAECEPQRRRKRRLRHCVSKGRQCWRPRRASAECLLAWRKRDLGRRVGFRRGGGAHWRAGSFDRRCQLRSGAPATRALYPSWKRMISWAVQSFAGPCLTPPCWAACWVLAEADRHYSLRGRWYYCCCCPYPRPPSSAEPAPPDPSARRRPRCAKRRLPYLSSFLSVTSSSSACCRYPRGHHHRRPPPLPEYSRTAPLTRIYLAVNKAADDTQLYFKYRYCYKFQRYSARQYYNNPRDPLFYVRISFPRVTAQVGTPCTGTVVGSQARTGSPVA